MIIYLDTNVVIYAVEYNAAFSHKARARLAAAQVAGDLLMISDLSRMECLVGPFKSGNAAVEADFQTFFGVTSVVAVTPAVCDRAARIRAAHNFKSMDALQLAAATEHGADVFLTADARLRLYPGVAVEVLY